MTEVQKKRKTLKGVVVSNKMKDTAVVLVERFVKHPKYGKYLVRRKRYSVHDVGNTKQPGDKATIEETRPVSKTKHFKIIA